MNPRMEQLLVHWGDQVLQHGQGGGCYSVLGSLVEWGGPAPRGTPGAVALVTGTGLDSLAARVADALAVIQRAGCEIEAQAEARGRLVRSREAQMYRLAWARYASPRRLTVAEQTAAVGMSGDRMYTRRLDDLHERLETELRALVSRRVA